MDYEYWRLPAHLSTNDRCGKAKRESGSQRLTDIRTWMVSVQNPSLPQSGCACAAVVATGHLFVQNLQL